MASIGDLTVNLIAKTGKFAKGMKRASRVTRGFSRRIGRLANRVKTFGLIAGGVAVAGITAMVKQQFNAIDATAKLADRVGASTEKLVGLRRAAELTGAGAGKLDEGMNVLAKRLGEASRGAGAARAALDQMGLSVDELIAMSPSRQFAAIADAMNQLGTQAERNAAAANLFSRSNQALVNTLALGSKGLSEVQQRAEAMGLTFSRSAAAKVEVANDAFGDFLLVVKGIARQLAIQLAPFVEAVSNKMVEFGISAGGAGRKVVAAFESVVVGIAKVADFIELAKAAFFAFQSVGSGAILAVLQPLRDFVEALIRLGDILGIDVGRDTLRFFKSIGDAFEEQVVDGARKASEAMDNFLSKTASTNARKVFDDIRRDADKAAQDVADKVAKARRNAGGNGGPGGLASGASTSGSQSQFASVRLGLTALGGVMTNRNVDVTDQAAVEELRRLRALLSSRGVTISGA